MTFDLVCRPSTLSNSVRGRRYQFRHGFLGEFWVPKEDEKLTKVEWDVPAITL